MKYMFNKNQIIPKYIKKKLTAFCLCPYKNSILWKEVWLTGGMCLNNSYLIISHLEKNTNYKDLFLETMSRLTVK